MRVALVHEFLTQLGGAERVLECFHEMFPDAPVFTIVHDKEKTAGRFASWDVRTSFIQRLPGGIRHYKYFLPLMVRAVESFSFREFDLVMSDSSAFAKGVKVSPNTAHISYCHTPTRYLWESMDEYVQNSRQSWLLKMAIKPYLRHYLKKWDYQAAQRPHHLIANSQTVRERIKKHYQRVAEVIYPPVDTEFFAPFPPNPPRLAGALAKRARKREERWGWKEFYVTVGRLEPYKKIDLVVKAFNKLGLPLIVAGTGTNASHLRSLAKDNIRFCGRLSDEELRSLYARGRAFVFPALEDAGIAVLESLACGTPVIGLNQGGTPEFITDGIHGVLFEHQTAGDIINAVKRIETMTFAQSTLRERALEFDKEKFKEKMMNFINSKFPPHPLSLSPEGSGEGGGV